MAASYRMPAELELALAYYAVMRPDQSGKIVADLDPTRLDIPGAKLIVALSKEILQEQGRGPDQPAQIYARHARHIENGTSHNPAAERLAMENFLALANQEREKSRLLSFETVAMELGPFIREQLHMEALSQLNDAIVLPDQQRKSAIERAQRTLSRIQASGIVDVGIGSFLSPEGILDLKVAHHTDLLGCRVIDMDWARLARRQVGLVTGDAKAGKSFWCSDVAANALLDGHVVYYACTEPGMSEDDIKARVVAAVTGVRIQDLFAEKSAREKAAKIFIEKKMRARAFCVRKFPARVTKIDDILTSFRQAEQVIGEPISLLIIDHTKFVDYDHESPSLGYGIMYAKIANFTQENAIFTWVAHHCKGGVKGLIGIDDLGWSKEIVATIDVGFSVNPNMEKTSNQSHLFAHRTQQDGAVIDLPRHYHIGRYGPWKEVATETPLGFEQLGSW